MTDNKITITPDGIAEDGTPALSVHDDHGNSLTQDLTALRCSDGSERELSPWEQLKTFFFDVAPAGWAYEAKHGDQPLKKGQPIEVDLGDFPSPLQQLCNKDRTPQK